MPRELILAKFLELFFNTYSDQVKEYYKNGRNSIRLKLHDQKELVFTYNDDNDWDLKTIYHKPQRAGA